MVRSVSYSFPLMERNFTPGNGHNGYIFIMLSIRESVSFAHTKVLTLMSTGESASWQHLKVTRGEGDYLEDRLKFVLFITK